MPKTLALNETTLDFITQGGHANYAGISGGFPYGIGTYTNAVTNTGTDTAGASGTEFVGAIFIPMNCTVTGIGYLIGATGGTDKAIVSLYSATGKILASSAIAGVTVGTAGTVQQLPFTTAYAAVGPAFYFLSLTYNGTTARFRSIPTTAEFGIKHIGNEVAGCTFGTLANIVVPTTFVADKVPIAALY